MTMHWNNRNFNPLPFILLAISLPLLLGGCGEKKVVEPVTEVKPVEEKQEVKEEAKPEEPVAETKPKTEGVNEDELERRGEFPNFIYFIKGSDTPYTGKSFTLYDNGQKEFEGNWKDGKLDGLVVTWYENGQKWTESNYKDDKEEGLEVWWHKNGQKWTEENYKDGKPVKGSAKFWNSKGEPVDTYEEAEE